MRKPVKEIENVLQNHSYSINNYVCHYWSCMLISLK